MAQSTIAYNIFITIGDTKLKFSTKDGGRHLEFVEAAELPAGVSKEGFEHVFGKLMSMAREATVRIEKDKADSAEQSRQAKAARQAQMIEGEAQAQRTARRNHFLRVADDSKQRVQFDSATMWKTRDRNLASSIAAKGVLQFLGPSDDYSFAFSDPEHIGDQICRRCLQQSLKRSAPNSGGVRLVTCSNPECHYHDYESGERPERPRSALQGRVQLVG